jgi:flagellar assembly protein FliH
MSNASKFQFGEAFEVDNKGYVRMDDGPKAIFTEHDLAAARGEGQKIGYETGLQTARNEIQAAAAQALDGINGELQQIAERHAQAILEIQADAANLAMAIANKLAPALMRQQPLEEVRELIADCLSQMNTEPRIVVRVAEALVDELNDSIDDVAAQSGFAGKLVLIGEPALRDADCRIEWADGGSERDLAVLMSQVEQAVERYAAAMHDEAERMGALAEARRAERNAAELDDFEPEPALQPCQPEPVDEDDEADIIEDPLPTLNRMPATHGGETAQASRQPAFDEPQE